MLGTRLFLHLEDVSEFLQRHLRLAINVDDIPKFLQWPKDKERVEPKSQELPDVYPLRKNQVHHEKQNARPHGIDTGSLNETQAPDVPDLLEFQFENSSRRRIEATHFLIGEAKAFDQLDIPQRLRRGTGKRSGFSHDIFLDCFDLLAQSKAEHAKNRNRQEIDGRDHPIHTDRVDHYENNPDQRNEEQVHPNVQ